MNSHRFLFLTLISVVFISGLTQGILLPLLSILLEERGVSASLNGLNASVLYFGIIVSATIAEKVLYHTGYKPMMHFGLLPTAILIFLFPVFTSYSVWMVFRFCMGLTGNILHYATVVWLTNIAPPDKRGRYLSAYGFSFGLGFAIGPLLTQLRHISDATPFIVSGVLTLVSVIPVLKLVNHTPQLKTENSDDQSQSVRLTRVLGLAWFAFLPTFGYGFLETAMSGSLPVFMVRHGFSGVETSTMLTVFFSAGLITQLPLGWLSDRIGRKKTLIIGFVGGISGFILSVSQPPDYMMMLIGFGISGASLGSIYSLGISYLVDCIPKHLLPAGNTLGSVTFSLGSLLGPLCSGIFIQEAAGYHFSWILVFTFTLLLLGFWCGKKVN